MNVQFVASVAPLVQDSAAARASTATRSASRSRAAMYTHFGLWPLWEAATACVGISEWPSDVPVPRASIEFEVADFAAAARELETKGYRLGYPVCSSAGLKRSLRG